MRLGLGHGVATFALLLAACGGGDQNNEVAAPPGGQKIAPIAPPAGSDWTKVIVETPEGGFRIGNPNAPVKLMEYGSFGCSHCAAFEAEGGEPLINGYVKSGRVSWEFRSYLIFAADPAISMLTRCHGPQAFFLLKQQLYATQADWEGRLMQSAKQLEDLPPEARRYLDLGPGVPPLLASGRAGTLIKENVDVLVRGAIASDRVAAISAPFEAE